MSASISSLIYVFRLRSTGIYWRHLNQITRSALHFFHIPGARYRSQRRCHKTMTFSESIPIELGLSDRCANVFCEVRDYMRRLITFVLVSSLAFALVGCGGGRKEDSASAGSPSNVYRLSSTAQASNSRSVSLQTAISGVNVLAPAVPACSLSGPTSLSMWVGDYSALTLGSNDIANIAQMTTRKQVYFSNLTLYQSLVANPSVLAGEQSLTIPKGNTEIWFEFYCASGTLAAGKVSV